MTLNANKPLLVTATAALLAAAALTVPAVLLLDGDAASDHGLAIRDAAAFLGILGVVLGASAFFYHAHAVRRVYAKIVLPLALVLTSTLVALVLVEAVLHFMYKDVQIGGSDSPSGYTFYKKYYKRNSWGFRDFEREEVKKPGTFRILTLGDSFTFGAGVKYKESLYTALLESKLNGLAEAVADFEVINSGLKGLSTAQELRYLQDEGLRLDPDLVVVGHVLNDAETAELSRAFQRQYRESTVLPPRYHRLFNRYSFTYYLARQNLISLLRRSDSESAAQPSYDTYLQSLYRGPNLDAYETIMVELNRTCEERGIPVLWVSFPRLPFVFAEPYPYSNVAGILRDIADRNRFRLIELRQAIVDRGNPVVTVSAWDGHPNEVVHEIAAEEIFDWLIAERLVPLASD